MDILASLSELHVAALRIGGQEWRPTFTMRLVAVAHCEIVEQTCQRRDVCRPSCPLWNRPEPHEHFQIQIGYGFRDCWNISPLRDDRGGERSFDFEQKKLEGDAGQGPLVRPAAMAKSCRSISRPRCLAPPIGASSRRDRQTFIQAPFARSRGSGGKKGLLAGTRPTCSLGIVYLMFADAKPSAHSLFPMVDT